MIAWSISTFYNSLARRYQQRFIQPGRPDRRDVIALGEELVKQFTKAGAPLARQGRRGAELRPQGGQLGGILPITDQQVVVALAEPAHPLLDSGRVNPR